MRACTVTALAAAILIICTGCASLPSGPGGPPPVAESVRQQMKQLAIRGPSQPAVSLTSMLDDKGAAAGRTARSAGLGWLGGSLRAAGETGDPLGASLIAAFGIVTAPVVAAGGAIYGASVADSEEAVERGNAVIARALDFTAEHFRHALEGALGDNLPLTPVFVPADTPDAALQAQGFDTVLDIRMTGISSQPASNQLEVIFSTLNAVTLTALPDGRRLERRSYSGATTERTVSAWAHNDAERLHADLDEIYARMAGEIADAFFLAPAIRVDGLEPVSRRRFNAGRIAETRPTFVWSALDGEAQAPEAPLEYELLIARAGGPPQPAIRTRNTRYVPAEPLRACARYEWRLRAHYPSFGRPAASDWSPTYRFKTPCNRAAGQSR